METADEGKLTKPLYNKSTFNKLILGFLVLAVVLGSATGYTLATKSSGSGPAPISEEAAKAPQQDTRTFRDFAEGTIKAKPESKDGSEYSEGTHLLMRDQGSPVALTSSVVDLSKYEGKKVKVYGETQKALKEGWLMDVGKIELK